MTGESGASPITIIRSSGLRRASSPSSPVMVLPSSSGAPTFAAAAEAKTSPGRGASSSPGGTGAVRPGIGAYRTTVNRCPSMYRSAARRIALFMEILDVIGHAEVRAPLASIGFLPDSSAYLSTAMNLVLQHIGRNFTRDLSEGDLARLGRQSVSTLSRSFRKHTGMTFVQYVNSLRIELACQHLSETDLTVTEICYTVGFNNVSNFNRQFLAAKGMSPSTFRALRRSGRRAALVA